MFTPLAYGKGRLAVKHLNVGCWVICHFYCFELVLNGGVSAQIMVVETN